jgi:hypothetical protein
LSVQSVSILHILIYILTVKGADDQEISCGENDQRNDEIEDKCEESVQVFLPFRCVSSMGHTLVKCFLKGTLLHVKHNHLKPIRTNH